MSVISWLAQGTGFIDFGRPGNENTAGQLVSAKIPVILWAHNKSQILNSQNLASEEGDEKAEL
jgi:hypothetical protein